MENKKLTSASGAPVADNHNVATEDGEARCFYKTYGFLRNWHILTAK